MNDEQVFTYQTRVTPNSAENMLLDAYAVLFGKVERSLFAKIVAGLNPNKLKNTFLKEFDITARQFNAVRVQVQGKIDAVKELRSKQITSVTHTVDSIKNTLKKCIRKKQKRQVHLKKRRLQRLERKLEKLQEDVQQKKVRICFGSKKLFRSQFSMDENGFETHEAWKNEWHFTRNSAFFIVGSKDETAGNQSCVATLDDDQTLQLRIRLPRALEVEYGKYLLLKNVHFSRGHAEICHALKSEQAITYRFVKDAKGWRVFATITQKQHAFISHESQGAIGVDINANHIACVETDRFGNAICKKTIPINAYGKSKEQTLALIGDASKELVSWAVESKKPLIFEKLNFQKKKASLKEEAFQKQSRMLSSFCYKKIFDIVSSKAFREGIRVHTVNPAYTSVIGSVKFSSRYGLSTHHAAALSIARRHFSFSENPTQDQAIVSGRGGQVTLSLPVRNRNKHVWSFWRQVKKKVATAHAAHIRARRSRSKGPP